jgi:hypothetical protein
MGTRGNIIGKIPPFVFFLSSELDPSKRRLVRVATRGVLENLELVPSNSRHNTWRKTLERQMSGNRTEIFSGK